MRRKSLALISDHPEMNHCVTQAVDSIEELSLETHAGTLSSVNGHVSHLVHEHDLLMFHLVDENDVEIVSRLRRHVGARGMLLALTERDIPLSEARALSKSGVDEILPFPIDQDELTAQIRKLTLDKSVLPVLYAPQTRRLGQVISICPARGGVGASTLTINLADQLQGHSGILKKQTKYRVAVVDLDLQFGTIASALDLRPSPGLMKMAQDGILPDRTFVQQSVVQHEAGLDVLTAPEEFMPLDVLTRAQIEALIETLRQDYDFIVIDLPRALVDWLGAVITASDRILMVGDSSVPSIAQACRLIDFFSRERLEPPIEMVMGHESKPTFKGGRHVEAQKTLGRELRYWLPDDAQRTKQALDRGQLLSRTSSNCSLLKAIRSMGRTILSETQTGAAGASHNAV